MAVKDGGPAFPVECDWIRTGDDIELRGIQTGGNSGWHEGMTLRDWFAGQALAGALSHPLVPRPDDTYPHQFAKVAYAIADAMLKERERP